MSFIISMLLILWTLFLFSSHPLQKILNFILTLITLMWLNSFLNKSSWFSLMFIMLMASGLMVIFLYFSSLTSNNNPPTSYSPMLIFIFSLFLLKKLSNSNTLLTLTMNKENTFLNMFKNLNTSIFISLLVFYMLIMLIYCIEMMSNSKCSFRAN